MRYYCAIWLISSLWPLRHNQTDDDLPRQTAILERSRGCGEGRGLTVGFPLSALVFVNNLLKSRYGPWKHQRLFDCSIVFNATFFHSCSTIFSPNSKILESPSPKYSVSESSQWRWLDLLFLQGSDIRMTNTCGPLAMPDRIHIANLLRRELILLPD